MAITFEDEEQRVPLGSYIIGFLFFAAIIVGGFFAVRYLIAMPEPEVIPGATETSISNKEILSDPRLDSLELLPQIVMNADEQIGREDPFNPVLLQGKAQEKQVLPQENQKPAAQ